ncbi:hypothetical protein [Mycetocola zhujimingii]|uniref:hypothetical protein n=1 Tax=Mycetocola zhujimingii TaxID=2079792 RepID=UPI000D3B3C38|nr:hypothetical protein [Mycetocola zhujimingii]AWB86664.1 hypothetical protein C3E77_08545 [Mycetocola zhujimingii]
MTSRDTHEPTVHSRGIATVFFCGAVIVLMFSVLTFGNATDWYEYVSGVVFVGLAATLTYRGVLALRTARDADASL